MVALFPRGTSHDDETTARIDHSEDVMHLYTGSHTQARRMLQRASGRPAAVREATVTRDRNGDPDGLMLTVDLRDCRDISTLIKT
jgi:hypothetical protein